MTLIKWFNVFHNGCWLGTSPSGPPSYFLITPTHADSWRMAKLIIQEAGLPLREPDRVGQGIPDSGSTTNYIKWEIENFLFAIGKVPAEYDYNSCCLFYPETNYVDLPSYAQYMAKVRRSVCTRLAIRDWLR